jgi:hypothetical protein
MRPSLAYGRRRVKCLSLSDSGFIVADGDLNAGAEWRGAVGTEMAMTLPERIEAIERVENAACARGLACPFVMAAHTINPIIKNCEAL